MQQQSTAVSMHSYVYTGCSVKTYLIFHLIITTVTLLTPGKAPLTRSSKLALYKSCNNNNNNNGI